MNDLVNQIAERTGIAPDTAERAVGMMLAFLQKEGDGAAVDQMIGAIPGGEALVAGAAGGGGGLMGSLMGAMGGGVMALGQQLMSQGLGMGEITALARETIAVAKQYAGEEVVDQVVASVPGLSQFV